VQYRCVWWRLSHTAGHSRTPCRETPRVIEPPPSSILTCKHRHKLPNRSREWGHIMASAKLDLIMEVWGREPPTGSRSRHQGVIGSGRSSLKLKAFVLRCFHTRTQINRHVERFVEQHVSECKSTRTHVRRQSLHVPGIVYI